MARKPFIITRGTGRQRRTLAGVLAAIRGLKPGERLRVTRAQLPAGERIIAAARAELGVLEHGGANTGERVRAYQASTTVPGTGWPWCAAFTRFVLDRAGVLRGGYRGAYVPSLEAWARATGRWRASSTTPGPGWLVVYEFTGDTTSDHVGIVESASRWGVHAIEGNTSSGAAGSQDDGGGVYRRTRPVSLVRGYVKTT